MKRFAYLDAATFEAASRALKQGSGKRLPKAAGTDLLDLMKERVLEPEALVNLLGAKDESKADHGRIFSALDTLDELARSKALAKDYPALHQAAKEAATPQIRNRGTVGGNLAQNTRCTYVRNAGFPCLKLEGSECAARREGSFTRFHTIFPQNGCVSAHSSNLAPALIALGAKVSIVGGKKPRWIEVEDLYAAPRRGELSDTILAPGELISRVELPTPSALTRRSAYSELRERQSFDFALVSLSVALDLQGGKIKSARICLSAVSPTPLRAIGAERVLTGKAPSEALFAAAAEAALKGAKPLADNGHKLTILSRLLRRTLKELCS